MNWEKFNFSEQIMEHVNSSRSSEHLPTHTPKAGLLGFCDDQEFSAHSQVSLLRKRSSMEDFPTPISLTVKKNLGCQAKRLAKDTPEIPRHLNLPQENQIMAEKILGKRRRVCRQKGFESYQANT